jgi:hypothetical protein
MEPDNFIKDLKLIKIGNNKNTYIKELLNNINWFNSFNDNRCFGYNKNGINSIIFIISKRKENKLLSYNKNKLKKDLINI